LGRPLERCVQPSGS